MKISQVLLLAPLLLLVARGAAAQPTCWYTYPPTRYCDSASFVLTDYVFVARVISLAPSPDSRPMSFRGTALVAVEAPLKGRVGRDVKMRFARVCAGELEEGGRYIFSARRAGGAELEGRYWSDVSSLSPEEFAEVMEGIRAVGAGARQPRIYGRVLGPESRPVPGVAVVARLAGAEYEARTNAAGRYRFEKLADGEYLVSLVYPKGLGPPFDDYGFPLKRDEKAARVHNQFPCGWRTDF
jgi:hypothetical protein